MVVVGGNFHVFIFYIFQSTLTSLIREGLKKIVENSTKRGGGSAPDFPLRKKNKKKHGLKQFYTNKKYFCGF